MTSLAILDRSARAATLLSVAAGLGALTGCTLEDVSCAEEPDAPGCDEPWICCVEPGREGCDPAEITRRCGGPGSDAGVDAATSTDAGPCPPCGGATPVCDESSGRCVECTGADASACTADELCVANACAECAEDADCTEPGAARCVDGACAPCTDSTQCAGLTDASVCDVAAGTCVQCTESDTSACGGSPCTHENTCSAFGTSQDTCEACDTDANCAEVNHFCVPMRYMGAPRPGGYCLQDATSTCTPPYFGIGPRRTVSGETGRSFCGIDEAVTTCEAVRALTRPCGTGCPEGGLCRVVRFVADLCTYPCQFMTECPQGSGFDCDDGGTGGPEYCGG